MPTINAPKVRVWKMLESQKKKRMKLLHAKRKVQDLHVIINKDELFHIVSMLQKPRKSRFSSLLHKPNICLRRKALSSFLHLFIRNDLCIRSQQFSAWCAIVAKAAVVKPQIYCAPVAGMTVGEKLSFSFVS